MFNISIDSSHRADYKYVKIYIHKLRFKRENRDLKKKQTFVLKGPERIAFRKIFFRFFLINLLNRMCSFRKTRFYSWIFKIDRAIGQDPLRPIFSQFD